MHPSSDFDKIRERMVRHQIEARGVSDPRVLAAMLEIPRHLFVGKAQQDRAYDDCPLPIGFGQTISQPYMVAVMTQLLRLTGTEKVLELGTGSGYQAAILARLARWVYTVERIPELAEIARENAAACGIENVFFIVADGTRGWPEQEPYDAIMVTAGAPDVPDPLFEQLAEGGRLVIPVGDRFSQTLQVVQKSRGSIKTRSCVDCRFVDLIGEYGWPDT
ncbi:MAG: protein-L-isoaspartate(D-aspartate) O-methyltransferase [Deltaproteobacteria bacterium]|nr:protein-L-isoaspartate(D-aspartate) O-methyltransferase [Deltaproteobacteria bacterium]